MSSPVIFPNCLTCPHLNARNGAEITAIGLNSSAFASELFSIVFFEELIPEQKREGGNGCWVGNLESAMEAQV